MLAEAPPRCLCYRNVFRQEFDCRLAETTEEFIRQIHAGDEDAAIICLCARHEAKRDDRLPFENLPNILPTLVCAKTLSPEVMRHALERGVEHFISCEMAGNEIEQTIRKAIARSGLKEYFARRWPVPPRREVQSPYTRKLVDEIVRAFPRRLKTSDMAERLGRSPRWLQKLCRRAFGLTYVHLLRHLWVYQALRLMQQTSFDNGEIAFHLNYTEESNLARDFRAELGLSPTAARRRLLRNSPEELLG